MLNTKLFLAILACLAIPSVGLGSTTVIKLGLGASDGSDIELVTISNTSTLGTVDDGDGDTIGDQNTDVSFLGALESQLDIPADDASFTLSGVTPTGLPIVVGGSFLVQTTSGGMFQLFDANNVSLLEGTLSMGSLSGPLGGSSTGSFLTTNLGSFTGGTLATLLDENSMSLSISLTSVTTPDPANPVEMLSGLTLSANNEYLDFTSDATANLGAEAAPEPSSLGLATLGIILFFAGRIRKK